MKTTVILLSLICICNANSAQSTSRASSLSYLNIKYDSVVIYFYGTKHVDGFPIVENNKLSGTVSASAKLDEKTAAELSKLLEQKESYGAYEKVATYKPSTGIVYWLNGKPIAYVSMHIRGAIIYSNIRIKEQEQGVISNVTKRYTLRGISEGFSQYLLSLFDKNFTAKK